MARYTNLANILRDAGLPVVEVAGWRTRGAELADIRAIMLHHTAASSAGFKNNNAPSLGVVRDGRPGISGPLSQFVLGRDGTWYVVASGLANHAGNGSGWGLPTNNANKYTLGIEAESTGLGSDWTPEQLKNYPKGVAALCKAFGLAWHRVLAHKEWAPTRKIDPAGWPGEIDGFRSTVKNILEGKEDGLDMTPQELQENVYTAVRNLFVDMDDNHGPASGDRFMSLIRRAVHDELEGRLAELNEKLDVIDTRAQQIQSTIGGS